MGTIAHVVIQIVEDGGASVNEISHVTVHAVEASISTAEIAHVIVQVVNGALVPTVPGTEFSGIYTVEPNKLERHDSYYDNIERKIPDPTIKTALIGE